MSIQSINPATGEILENFPETPKAGFLSAHRAGSR